MCNDVFVCAGKIDSQRISKDEAANVKCDGGMGLQEHEMSDNINRGVEDELIENMAAGRREPIFANQGACGKR